VGSKTTSVRIEEALWREFKALAAREGTTLSALLRELVSAAVEGARIAEKLGRGSLKEEVLRELRARRAREEDPFSIVHEKTAVELVKEGRGD